MLPMGFEDKYDFDSEYIRDLENRVHHTRDGFVSRTGDPSLIAYINMNRARKFLYDIKDFGWFLLSGAGKRLGTLAVDCFYKVSGVCIATVYYIRHPHSFYTRSHPKE